MCDVVVIGSLNVDLAVNCRRRPEKGETVMGEAFTTLPGGKGINQAVNAMYVGADVSMIGCIGDDPNGRFLIDYYENGGLFLPHVEQVPQTATGVAMITLADGDNSIIVVPGANHSISKQMIDSKLKIITESKLVVLQLEIPFEIVEYVINLCKSNHVPVMLNPAPAVKLTDKMIEDVDYLTPNQKEFTFIFGTDSIDTVVSKYPNKLLVTCGEDGVIYHDGDKVCCVPSKKVTPVDTTGAGDAFNGALAAYICKGVLLNEAIRLANEYAADSVTRFGAQPKLTTRGR